MECFRIVLSKTHPQRYNGDSPCIHISTGCIFGDRAISGDILHCVEGGKGRGNMIEENKYLKTDIIWTTL